MNKHRPKIHGDSVGMNRKDFLKVGALTAAGVGALGGGARAEENPPAVKLPPEKAVAKDDAMGRMENDILRAMRKPAPERHWVMVLDLLKCVGCQACTVACKSENVTPPGVCYTIVMEEEIGTYPNVRKKFIPRPCFQCANPPCVKVCPVRATHRDEEGVVEINYDQCIGCRYCITACPYGARYPDFGGYYTDGTPKIEAYEKRPNFEYQKLWPRERRLFFPLSPMGNARKCQFCLHRLRIGLLPACIVTCIGFARYFGDLNDEKSLVAELIAKHKGYRLKEELGTEPSVYYLD